MGKILFQNVKICNWKAQKMHEKLVFIKGRKFFEGNLGPKRESKKLFSSSSFFFQLTRQKCNFTDYSQ